IAVAVVVCPYERIGCSWLLTCSLAVSFDLAFTAGLSMGRHRARCSSERFKAKRCRSILAPTTIRCIGSTNGRPTFECWGLWKSRRYLTYRYHIPLLTGLWEPLGGSAWIEHYSGQPQTWRRRCERYESISMSTGRTRGIEGRLPDSGGLRPPISFASYR